MADDRPLETTEEAVGRLDGAFADFQSTVLARLGRFPTGTMLPTPAAVAPPNTLLLLGQTVDRAAYPALWQWVTDHGAVVAGLFGPGNGTTTFTLPDARNRVLVGAGGTYALGATGGLDFRTIVTANLPAHNHGLNAGSVASTSHTHADDALHSHSIGGDGNHAGHNSGAFPVAGGSGATVASTTQNSSGSHDHAGGTGGAGTHDHGPSSHGHELSGTTDNTGSGTAFDVRQPYLATNYLVYT